MTEPTGYVRSRAVRISSSPDANALSYEESRECNRSLCAWETAMYYPDYWVDLAAAIAWDRSEASKRRRAGPAKSADRYGRLGASQPWVLWTVAGLTVPLILCALLAIGVGVAAWRMALMP
jgi:hypothetical protein